MTEPTHAATAILDEGRIFVALIRGEIASFASAPLLASLLNRVNAAAFAGHPAGTLLLAGSIAKRNRTEVYFERNDSRPWNFYPSPEGPREVRIYDPADFAAIDGHRNTLDLEPVEGEPGRWKRVVAMPW